MAHVLIVDDEDEIRNVLSRWLTAAKHQVAEAPDADAALRALESAPADVVLCDVRMPGRDGLWLVEEIRKRFPSAGLVFATGETKLPPSSTLKEGVVAYVMKPFDKDKVLAAVTLAADWSASSAGRAAKRQESDDALRKWLDEGK